jgi:hypothetical protein
MWGVCNAGRLKALLLGYNLRWYRRHRLLLLRRLLLLLNRRHDRRHDWLHLCARRDYMANGDGVEGRAREALREAVQVRIFGKESRHALFEFCDLSQLTKLGFVVVEEGEERFCPMNGLGLSRELANDGLEDGTSIYVC